jgi:lantibiotic modifying enzyme
MIQSDSKFDIISGSAGCILSLIQLFGVNQNQDILTKAKTCGNHLVNEQKRYRDLLPSWSVNDEIPLTGFSHGAAGISYALLMLNKITSDIIYKEAAILGIRYEQSQFDRIKMQYPDYRDFRKVNNGELLNSWCNGISGIVLGRLGGLSVYSDESINAEIKEGIKSVLDTDLHFVDHLCCGNFGRLETLLFYGINNNDTRIVCEVQNRTSALMKRAQRRGGFLIHPDIPDKFISPGFFQGLSGIGYQLLRIAEYMRIPSVLLFN